MAFCNMVTSEFLVLPLFFVLILSGLVSFSFATVDTEAQEDIMAGCRDEQSLVYRFTYQDYVCLDPSTAERWEKLGLAEIIQNATKINQTEMDYNSDTVYYGAPPPAPVKPSNEVSVDNSECRSGLTLVHRFSYDDLYCINSSTAKIWERLGLVQIINDAKESLNEKSLSTEISNEILQDTNTIQEVDDVENQKQIEKSIDSKNISLPSYPNQPTIRPELEATINFKYPPKVYQVNERIWVAVGYDTTNSVMIEGDKGIIIVDTLSTYETAKNVLKEFRKITDKPVKTIIYTNGNPDHVGGTKAFLDEGDGNVEIIAHEKLLDSYITKNIILGSITSTRTTYASGTFLSDDGMDDADHGVFPKIKSGTISFVSPTDTFSSTFSIDISGVRMELVHMSDNSLEQIYVWLPDDKALLIGDNIYGIFPNVYSLRGEEYQNPMDYVDSLDQMISLKPKHLVSSYVKPIINDQIMVLDVLTSTRDATQYLFDQTIRGMNHGYTADELSEMIKLPNYFEYPDWLSESRGQIPWHVKQIYYGNLGWYQGDPAFLLPIPEEQRSQKIVSGFGGVDNTILKIRSAIENNEYNWAAELATYVLNVDSNNDEAKLLKAHALRVIGQRMLSADGRNWALTSALELEGKIRTTDTFLQTNLESLMELPIEKILKILPTKINPDLLKNEEYVLNVIYTDIDQSYTLHFRSGILAITPGLNPDEDNTITLDTVTHKKIISGKLTLMDAIESNQLLAEHDVEDLQYFLDAIEM